MAYHYHILLVFTLLLNLLNVSESAVGVNKYTFPITKYNVLKTTWHYEQACVYYETSNLIKSDLKCGSLCAKQNYCVFFTVNPNGQCITCLLKTIDEKQDDLILWTKNLTDYPHNLYTKCIELDIESGTYGSFNGSSYWIFKNPQLSALGSVTSDGVNVNTYTIELNFKTYTSNLNGILFFMDTGSGTAESSRNDFTGAYVKSGQVKHAINNWAGVGTASTTTTFNDGLWHLARFKKVGDQVTVCVDGVCQTAMAPATGGTATTRSTYYFGGIPDSEKASAQAKLGVDTGFIGCITNITLNGVAVGTAAEQHYMEHCCLGVGDQ